MNRLSIYTSAHGSETGEHEDLRHAHVQRPADHEVQDESDGEEDGRHGAERARIIHVHAISFPVGRAYPDNAATSSEERSSRLDIPHEQLSCIAQVL